MINDFYVRGMNMAIHASRESDDPDTQTGCAIYEPGAYNPFTTDSNRLPYDIDKTPERLSRPEKYNWIEHAERNAIYGKNGHDLQGCVMFLNWFPCADCARAIVAVGISELVYTVKPERWADPRYGFETSKKILIAGGVKLTPFESDL
jgi:dCMP deaminase